MSHTTLILLLSTAALLICTEGQQDYHTLDSLSKNSINLAITHIHKTVRPHMNFFGILEHNEDSDYLSMKVVLKATNCAKNGENTHRDDCKSRTGNQRFACVICGERSGSELTEPFTDCIQRRRLPEKENYWKKKCVPTYNPGMHSLMSRAEY
ncbi:hypothetical protein AGOR_G00041010 [Albula goreensis]|uniref:Uncharacterized protein n=1 Tax=Albula goreensis TaxID=1534307 RepID=A0A8T3E5D0_9TELE|nr:hypothetical protein AGOR_G00041010 [Albula goreensis]